MTTLILLMVVAVISAGITALVRSYALKGHLIDTPNTRSSHSVPTPRGGGLGIVVSVQLGLLAWQLMGGLDWRSFTAGSLAGLLVAVVGFGDDLRPLPARIRILAHFLAAAGVVVGLYPGLARLGPGWSSIIIWLYMTVLVIGLVWLLNLYNFMDGIDGLAGVEAVSVAGAAAFFLWVDGDINLAAWCGILAAGSLGFLVWNWPPARIFMGDVGSGFLGLGLGTLALASGGASWHRLAAWIILLGVFEVDATVTLIRRAARGARWWEAHREHAYQHAARRWGHRKVTMACLAINLLWLIPWAGLAWWRPATAPWAVIAALAPLVVQAVRGRAGTPE